MRTKPFVLFLILWMAFIIIVALMTRPAAAQAGCSVRTDWQTYTVRRGDTLYLIARRYSATTTILAIANCLTNSNKIYAGQVLRVPGAGGGANLTPVPSTSVKPITFQAYEGGYLLWWAETGEIWELTGAQGGSLTSYPSRTYGGLPDNPVQDATPANRVRPIMGFGRLWGNFALVRSQLGWATASEQSFISTVNYDAVSRRYLFSVPGGRTLFSDGRTWSIFTGTTPTQPPLPQPTAVPTLGGRISIRASYQPFENGFMTWRSDTGQIDVYFGANNGNLTGFLPDYYGNLPDNPFTNPFSARIRPILGFGRVWGNVETVRNQLGWATAPELGYTMQIQQDFPLVKVISVPAGAGGSIRWVFNDRGLYWDFTPAPASSQVVVATAVPTATLANISVVTTNAAYQVFEDGFMVWRADTGDILVFPKHRDVNYFGQVDYQNLADNPVTDTPPDARSSPINGFGRVWGNFSQVRSALGWALDTEKSYSATLHTLYVPSPDGVKSIPGYCFNLPDGSSVKFPEYVDATTITWGLVDSCG